MSPEENLNDFIAGQVLWLSAFMEDYAKRMCGDESVPQEMTPEKWLVEFREWQEKEMAEA